jgi:hypothetical protein
MRELAGEGVLLLAPKWHFNGSSTALQWRLKANSKELQWNFNGTKKNFFWVWLFMVFYKLYYHN